MFPIGPIFAKANEENRQVNPHVDICRSPCAFCAGNSSTSPHTVECEQSQNTCEVLKHLVSFRDQPMWHKLLENCRKNNKKTNGELQSNEIFQFFAEVPTHCNYIFSLASLSIVDIHF